MKEKTHSKKLRRSLKKNPTAQRIARYKTLAEEAKAEKVAKQAKQNRKEEAKIREEQAAIFQENESRLDVEVATLLKEAQDMDRMEIGQPGGEESHNGKTGERVNEAVSAHENKTTTNSSPVLSSYDGKSVRTGTSQFGKLPLELREAIYKYALLKPSGAKGKHPPLLRALRRNKMYYHALEFFYKINWLEFTILEGKCMMEMKCNGILGRIRNLALSIHNIHPLSRLSEAPPLAVNIRSLKLSVHCSLGLHLALQKYVPTFRHLSVLVVQLYPSKADTKRVQEQKRGGMWSALATIDEMLGVKGVCKSRRGTKETWVWEGEVRKKGLDIEGEGFRAPFVVKSKRKHIKFDEDE